MEPEVRAMTTFARSNMVHTPDEELAARCRAGDTDAFAEVYARCERPVFRCAYHLLGCREDADDAKQETFVRAWQAIRGFNGDCALHMWLLRICANVCRDRMKSQRRHPSVPADERIEGVRRDSISNDDPAARAEKRFESEALEAAMRGMPEVHREIIVLREFEGLSYDELAGALGCSTASVKVRLFRARRLLKQRFTALLEERS